MQDWTNWVDNVFLKRNNGYFPKFKKMWFDKVNNNHKDIRKFIGGDLVQKFYKLKSQQRPVTMADADPIIDQILKIVPNYLTEYEFTRDVFLLPTIPRGTHNAIKMSRHVRTYAEQRFSDPIALKNLDKLLSSLGDLWSKSRTTESEIEITLSTTHRGFTLLGHYGPDQDSCFRQTSDKTLHKYILAQSPHTFVITLSKFNEKRKKNTNVARCFGFFNANYTAVGLANYYFSPKFPEGDAIETIRLLFEELWKDKVEFHENKTIVDRNIFQNPYANWAFSKGEKSYLSTLTFKADVIGLRYFSCHKCGRDGTNEGDFEEVDDSVTCYSCYDRANICEMSNKRTFLKLESLIKDTGEMLMIHPDIAKEYEKCSNCNCRTSGVIDVGGVKICSSCEEIACTPCECCNKQVKDSDLVDVGFGEICPECFEAGEIDMDKNVLYNLLEILGPKDAEELELATAGEIE